jgi:5-hydroxyisourate hydrolase
MSLSTHVLDTSRGRPAPGVGVTLEIANESGSFDLLAERVTDDDGRVRDLLAGGALRLASYRLTFATGTYFEATGQPVFYPHVSIVFHVHDVTSHHHVPLLLSPFGYSTYRGS